MKTIGSVLKRLLIALGGSASESYYNDITLVDKIAELAENGEIESTVIRSIEIQAGTLTVSNSVTLAGYLTDGSKEMTFDYVLPRITRCQNVAVTKFKGNVRGVNGGNGGYVDSSSSTSVDWYGTGYTTTATLIGINRVRITVKKSTSFSNATNNTPVVFYGQITLVFS